MNPADIQERPRAAFFRFDRAAGAVAWYNRTMQAWRPVWKKLPWLALLPLGLLWPVWLRGAQGFAENVYAERLYPAIRGVLSLVTSWLPFSVAELLLYALVVGAAALLTVRAVCVLRGRAHVARLVSALLSVLLLGCALLHWFYLSWGVLYFRAPLAGRMGLDVRARSAEELTALCETLLDDANGLRATLVEDSDGAAYMVSGTQRMLDAMPAAYARATKDVPALGGGVTRAKRVLCSRGLSAMGVAGIFVGMTAEPNLNTDQPDLLQPAGAAHETAHQGGLASEEEAEFASYLICCASDDAFVRYSGTVSALLSSMRALKAADPDAYARLLSRYGDGLARDLSAYDAYWSRYDGGAADEAQTALNDAYLKFNGQESGVESYGECVDLLLAWHAQTKN